MCEKGVWRLAVSRRRDVLNGGVMAAAAAAASGLRAGLSSGKSGGLRRLFCGGVGCFFYIDVVGVVSLIPDYGGVVVCEEKRGAEGVVRRGEKTATRGEARRGAS